MIGNTSTGNALTYYDGSNGDLVGNDYMHVGQYNDLRGVIETAASAGNISLSPKVGAGTVEVSGSLQVSSDINVLGQDIQTGADNALHLGDDSRIISIGKSNEI
jgi:hypothetical protein